ncbi:YqcC family protein [Vibrio amylolyticus]|uniref:YqcC family protein n=1 Tax=Vibrio amylolyticus TaxID=2847292 RepID=UPI00354E3AB6
MTQSAQLFLLLDELQQELNKKQLWQAERPSQAALNSTQPFAVDTLNPEQWLQWIFIPKIRTLIDQNSTLPTGFSIAPYFEQAWQGQPDYRSVVMITQMIDEAVKSC